MPKRKLTQPPPHGRYAQLTLDFAFKKAFGTEQDKDLLIALLNAFLERKLPSPIIDVHIANPYVPGKTRGKRGAIFDIHCQDTMGNKFMVEMQMAKQKFFIQRTLFNLSMAITNSIKKGEDSNFSFPCIYSLNFLNFDLDFGEGCNNIMQYISLSNEDKPKIRYKYVNLVYVRLTRFGKSIEECRSLQDKLLFTLRHAHELKTKPKQLKGTLFDRLYEIMEFSNFTDMEYSEYMSQMIAKIDRRAQLACAREEGFGEGKTEGRAEGREEILDLIRQGKSLADIENLIAKPHFVRDNGIF